MRRILLALALIAAGCRTAPSPSAAPVAAPTAADSGAFVVLLGRDTLSAETFTRAGNRITGQIVRRMPRATVLSYDLTLSPSGYPTRLEYRTRLPDGSIVPNGSQSVLVTFRDDSVVTELRRDTVVRRATSAPRAFPEVDGSVVSFWLPVNAARTTGRDSLRFLSMVPGGSAATGTSVSRRDDRTWWYDFFGSPLELRLDDRGLLESIDGARSTFKIVSLRQTSLDVGAVARSFASRELAAGPLSLSPRDSAVAVIGAARILVDYGRPSARGRRIWTERGVLGDSVWRTGANAGTRFVTPLDLMIGGQRLPAGTYIVTTFTLPGRHQLILSANGRDVLRVPLEASPLTERVEQFAIAVEPTGASTGRLRLSWDDLALSTPFRILDREIPPPIRHLRDLARREYSGDSAKAIVAYMERWFRVPGNPGYDSSITHVQRYLARAGYVLESRATARDRLVYRVEIRPMAAPAWSPVDAELSIVGEGGPLLRYATNRNMLAINSYSTPAAGIVAELVDAGAGGRKYDSLDVRGKVVLVRSGANAAFREAVIRRGALGVLAYNQAALTQPEKNTGSITFTSVERDTTRKAWAIALSYGAYQRLSEALGRGPVRVRVWTRSELTPAAERTIVAEVRGRSHPAERFVLSAHVQEPGANDNASGVGTLAEMARFMATQVRRGAMDPARSITMIFGNEIAQTRNYLADSTRARTVKWGMSLDMTGQDVSKTGGTFLIEKMPDPSAVWTRGEEKHSEWGGQPMQVKDIRQHYFNDVVLDRCLDQADGTGWVVRTNPYEGGSDHVPFLDAGKPAVLLWHFTDQFYHTDGDRLEMVSAAEQKNVGICALLTASALASADGALTRQIADQVAWNAERRLRTEFALSRAALQSGAKLDDERLILETWTSFYRGALEALRDLEVGGASAETLAKLSELSQQVARSGADHAAALRQP